MPTRFAFTGKALSFKNITLHAAGPDGNHRPTRIQLDDSDDHSTLVMEILIIDSVINVTCELSGASDELNVDSLYHQVYDMARALVDLAAFSNSIAITTVIDEYTDPSGASHRIRSRDEMLDGILGVPPLEVLPILVRDWEVRLALHELATTLERPGLIPVNCARAIERLAQILSGHDQNKARRWDILRSTLRASEEYVKYISGGSAGPRHGDHGSSNTQEQEIRKRAWELMSRFLAFRKGGNAPLDPGPFPMLK